jgi:hypothetical protein
VATQASFEEIDAALWAPHLVDVEVGHEILGQPLVTFDARLAKASGIRAEIEVLG